ncbi:MAG TPA: hypothetical protein VLJ39_04045 [Tepidisphaeraceae bacterium]|nr:hypothetical protein [Tepidisphaeraceae bacterium]
MNDPFQPSVTIAPLPPLGWTAPNLAVRQTLTSVCGAIAIALGATGLLLVVLQITLNAASDGTPEGLALAGDATSLLTKVLLITTGVLLLRRSWLALPMTIGTLVLSAVSSGLTLMLLPSMSQLSPAAATGRMFGRCLAVVLPLVLYSLLIVHLRMPRTRAEFRNLSASWALPPAL